MAGIEEAGGRLMKGVRDPEGMREAAREMGAARDEFKKWHREMNVAVDRNRDCRNEP